MYYDKIDLNGAVLEAYCPDVCTINANGPKRTAIVICGGGGYRHVSDREDEPIALRFLTMGFCTFTINYHIAPSVFPTALQDVASAVAWVRQHADDFHIDKDKIVVSGFSAGGHVAACLGVMWQQKEYFEPVGLSCELIKPNAMVLCYPVITAGTFAHRGSFDNLTGSTDVKDHEAYSLENLVSENTPPTFLWHTWADETVPVENTLLFASALRRAGREAELHIYAKGAHGLALANEITAVPGSEAVRPELQGWPELAGRFLKQILN